MADSAAILPPSVVRSPGPSPSVPALRWFRICSQVGPGVTGPMHRVEDPPGLSILLGQAAVVVTKL